VHKAFERAVFNVLFHNRDDHSKNLSFQMGSDRRWRLAPAYDLTFSNGPGGEHHLDVGGEGKFITRANLLELAKDASLTRSAAGMVIDRFLEVAANARQSVGEFAIRKATVAAMVSAINEGIRRLSATGT
jgi:serine/threonine-protein kinase HipA